MTKQRTTFGPAPVPSLTADELEAALRHYVQGFGSEPSESARAILVRDGLLEENGEPTPAAYMAVQVYEDEARERRLAAGEQLEEIKGPKAGDRIRSNDFEPRAGRGDCYVEGPVLLRARAQGVDWVFLACERDVYRGEETGTRVGHVIRTPLRTTFEWPGRLEVITSEVTQ